MKLYPFMAILLWAVSFIENNKVQTYDLTSVSPITVGHTSTDRTIGGSNVVTKMVTASTSANQKSRRKIAKEKGYSFDQGCNMGIGCSSGKYCGDTSECVECGFEQCLQKASDGNFLAFAYRDTSCRLCDPSDYAQITDSSDWGIYLKTEFEDIDCFDLMGDFECKKYEGWDYCLDKLEFMRENCKKACGLCEGGYIITEKGESCKDQELVNIGLPDACSSLISIFQAYFQRSLQFQEELNEPDYPFGCFALDDNSFYSGIYFNKNPSGTSTSKTQALCKDLKGPCYCKHKGGDPDQNEVLCKMKNNFEQFDPCRDDEGGTEAGESSLPGALSHLLVVPT